MLEMLVNVFNMHRNVLAYLVGVRGPKLATLTAQHDCAFGNCELRMGDAASRSLKAQALRETEGVAEPVDRLRHVFIDEDGYYSCPWCRPVYQHNDLRGRGLGGDMILALNQTGRIVPSR